MQTAPESSTETDIRHHSNDLSTKESEGTVNMQTAPESSTETDIRHHSNDLSTKESEGTVCKQHQNHQLKQIYLTLQMT